MEICLIFILSNGLALGTVECEAQLFYGDGLVTPHEVVYNPRLDEHWEGYLFYIPEHKIRYSWNTRYIKYYVVHSRHINRIRYRGKVHHHRHKHHKYKKRTVLHKKRLRRRPVVIRNRSVINSGKVRPRRYNGGNNKRKGKRKKHKR